MPLKRRFLPIFWVALALLALVPVLAWMQYRWLDRLVRREAEHRRTHLTTSALQFAWAFNERLIATQTHFAMQPDSSLETLADTLRERIESWNATRDANLIRALFFVRNDGAAEETSLLLRYDATTGRFLDAALPNKNKNGNGEDLTPSLRDSIEFLASTPPPTTRILSGMTGMMIPIIPIQAPQRHFLLLDKSSRRRSRIRPNSAPNLAPDNRAEVRHLPDYVVIIFDEHFLRANLLGSLVQEYCLSDEKELLYSCVIRESESKTVLFQSHTTARDSASTADIVFPIGNVPARPPRLQAGALPASIVTRLAGMSLNLDSLQRLLQSNNRAAMLHQASPQFELHLRYANGSLEDDIRRAQWGNIAVSVGLVLLFGAGLGLIVVVSLRAGRLARQQMQFVAGVSHEFRTPLAALRSASENLAHGIVKTPEQAQRYGTVMRQEINRLWEMVEQTLMFAGVQTRAESNEIQMLAVPDLIEQAIKVSRMFVSDDTFSVHLDIEPNLPHIEGNHSALVSAMANLLSNAVKYGSDEPLRRKIDVRARLLGTKKGREIALSVQDYGIGIGEKERKHIFEPFYRVRDVQESDIRGNGLGLALVKSIVERHKGRITLDSTPGEGSTFTLHLPTSTT
jgi:signal transduction histidine kinase